jgi:hypothetical protein
MFVLIVFDHSFAHISYIVFQILVMYPSPSIITCTIRVWLREIGFSLAYGALMLKTWR